MLSNNHRVLIGRWEKLAKVRKNLKTLYRDTFVADLFNKATDRINRYKKVDHCELKIGDIVTIKSDMLKPYQYPLAKIVNVEKNDLGETTAALLRKSNGETVRRHAEHIIFVSKGNQTDGSDVLDSPSGKIVEQSRPKRRAANKCNEKK